MRLNYAHLGWRENNEDCWKESRTSEKSHTYLGMMEWGFVIRAYLHVKHIMNLP